MNVGTTQAPSVNGRTTWMRDSSRNISQGLILPTDSYGCVKATASIQRVSLNIHEGFTNMVVDWLGTSATFLDAKRKAVHSGDAHT